MTDVHDKSTRSYNMSQIRSKDTKPELIVRKYLFSKGFRYRLYDNRLPGKPDIVLPKYKTLIFINGCFWHGHEGCKYFVIPKTRIVWWLNKIVGNKEKDTETYAKLGMGGWKIIIVWECQLKPDNKDATLTNVIQYLNSGNTCN